MSDYHIRYFEHIFVWFEFIFCTWMKATDTVFVINLFDVISLSKADIFFWCKVIPIFTIVIIEKISLFLCSEFYFEMFPCFNSSLLFRENKILRALVLLFIFFYSCWIMKGLIFVIPCKYFWIHSWFNAVVIAYWKHL